VAFDEERVKTGGTRREQRGFDWLGEEERGVNFINRPGGGNQGRRQEDDASICWHDSTKNGFGSELGHRKVVEKVKNLYEGIHHLGLRRPGTAEVSLSVNFT